MSDIEVSVYALIEDNNNMHKKMIETMEGALKTQGQTHTITTIAIIFGFVIIIFLIYYVKTDNNKTQKSSKGSSKKKQDDVIDTESLSDYSEYSEYSESEDSKYVKSLIIPKNTRENKYNRTRTQRYDQTKYMY